MGGYPSIFIACIILYGVALFYVVVFVKSDKPETDSTDESNMFNDMFNVEAVKDTVLTCFRKRSGSKRLYAYNSNLYTYTINHNSWKYIFRKYLKDIF